MEKKAHGAHIDVSERLSEGYTPSPMPPIGPDGAPVLSPPEPLIVFDDAQWICQRGPCRKYHRMVTTVDAQRPLDGSAIGDHTQTVHTCYPHPGVEIDLGDVLVTECSRWDPKDPSSPEERDLERRRMALDSSIVPHDPAEATLGFVGKMLLVLGRHR